MQWMILKLWAKWLGIRWNSKLKLSSSFNLLQLIEVRKFELWCLVASVGLHFCVPSTSFQNINIGWPQQPPTEDVSDISKILDFWWFIPQNGTGIDHLGAWDDQTIRISKIFDEMRLLRSLRPLRLLRPLRSSRLQRF